VVDEAKFDETGDQTGSISKRKMFTLSSAKSGLNLVIEKTTEK
jgi:hypothetical protein